MRLPTLALLLLVPAPQAEDIAWIHCSDTHAPMAGTEETIKEMRALGEIELEPYKIKAPAPSFVIVSGDLTEFGGAAAGKPAWDAYLGYWKNFKIPVYHGMGNHDATWDCLAPALRKLHGATSYSFDKAGLHFVCLDSSTPQEPRPSFGEEKLIWLAADLKKVGPETPVILTMHHPPEGNEFASAYELDRFFGILEPYNVVAMLVGHYHTAWRKVINGIDVVGGGATFTKDERKQPRGYNVCSVQGGVLRIAHKTVGAPKATIPLLEKKLARTSSRRLVIVAPPEDGTIRSVDLPVSISAEGMGRVKAVCRLDDDPGAAVPLKEQGGRTIGVLSTQEHGAGVHFVRVSAACEDGTVLTRSVRIFLQKESAGEVRWRVQLPTSVKGRPRPHGDRLYVGGVDGKLYALTSSEGKLEWTFTTDGEILGSPAVIADLVLFGSGDGNFYAVDTEGKLKWKSAAGAAVYSSPVVQEGLVIFGDNAGLVHAVDAASGSEKWKFQKAGYSIEAGLATDGPHIYFSAWDENVYALDAKTGKLVWRGRAKGPTERAAANRYYSPGHCAPVVSGPRVYCADRDYKLSIFDSDGIFRGGFEDVSAVGVTADGSAILIRRPSGVLSRLDLKAAPVWSTACGMDAVAAPPAEDQGIAYACSAKGLLSAVDAGTGKILWQRQVTPRLYVFAPPAARDRFVFVAGMDGSVTCVASK